MEAVELVEKIVGEKILVEEMVVEVVEETNQRGACGSDVDERRRRRQRGNGCGGVRGSGEGDRRDGRA